MGKTNWPATLPSLDDSYWATPAEISVARQNVQDENFQIGNAIETGDLMVNRKCGDEPRRHRALGVGMDLGQR
jgi:hypothetical protein